MPDLNAIEPERKVQGPFRLGELASALVFFACVMGVDFWIGTIPNRHELGPRQARIEFARVQLDSQRFAPFKLVGAWHVTSSDSRFGGVSALTLDEGKLLALTDSGALIRFALPGAQGSGTGEISELPAGPDRGDFKRNRDSEALVRDPTGRGWWVAFENRHELWLYDHAFHRALARISLAPYHWHVNRGVEGLASADADLLLFPEAGDRMIRLSGRKSRTVEIRPYRKISEAVGMRGSRVLALERDLTPLGFANALIELDIGYSNNRIVRLWKLPLGPLDNAEALAVEGQANGKRRLWLMTDDNFQPPLRTLLIALEMPASLGPFRN